MRDGPFLSSFCFLRDDFDINTMATKFSIAIAFAFGAPAQNINYGSFQHERGMEHSLFVL